MLFASDKWRYIIYHTSYPLFLNDLWMLQAQCNNTIIEKRRKDTQVLIQLIKPFVFDPLENILTRKVQQNIVGTFPLKNFQHFFCSDSDCTGCEVSSYIIFSCRNVIWSKNKKFHMKNFLHFFCSDLKVGKSDITHTVTRQPDMCKKDNGNLYY